MTIEISLTRSLAAFLNLKLSPSKGISPHINYFYLDIISKNRQKNLLLFNTYTSWICPLTLKDFKKNPLDTVKKYLKMYLLEEGLKEYIVDNYINDIDDIFLSLTNNPSSVARMSTKKKDCHLFYERYYDAPNLLTLLKDIKLNTHIVKNYQTNKNDDYFTPYIEMHAIIVNKYMDKDREEKDHKEYYHIKDDEFTYLTTPRDLKGLSRDEIYDIAKKISSERYYDIYAYKYESLYKDNPHPSMEDYFEVIHSNDELGSDYQQECEQRNLIFLKLDEDLYQIYKKYFLRKYNNKLPLDNRF